jgi:hypothetical protein
MPRRRAAGREGGAVVEATYVENDIDLPKASALVPEASTSPCLSTQVASCMEVRSLGLPPSASSNGGWSVGRADDDEQGRRLAGEALVAMGRSGGDVQAVLRT